VSNKHIVHGKTTIVVGSLNRVDDKDVVELVLIDDKRRRERKYRLCTWIELSGQYYSGVSLSNLNINEYSVDVRRY